MISAAIFTPSATLAEPSPPIFTTIYIAHRLLLLRKFVDPLDLLAQQRYLRLETRNFLLKLGLSIVVLIDCRILRSQLGFVVGYHCFEVSQLNIILLVLPQSDVPVLFELLYLIP